MVVREEDRHPSCLSPSVGIVMMRDRGTEVTCLPSVPHLINDKSLKIKRMDVLTSQKQEQEQPKEQTNHHLIV